MSAPAWSLRVSASAERSPRRLPTKVAAAIVEFLTGRARREPERVGHPLQRELAGLRFARRGSYRVVYELDTERRLVLVVRIDHRADVYRPR